MKVIDISSVVSSLTEEGFVNVDQAESVSNTLSGVSRDILSRLTHEDRKPITYPTELRPFTLTLKFYSKKAYGYVRKKFNLALPHPITIRTWCNHIDCDPRFTRDACLQ